MSNWAQEEGVKFKYAKPREKANAAKNLSLSLAAILTNAVIVTLIGAGLYKLRNRHRDMSEKEETKRKIIDASAAIGDTLNGVFPGSGIPLKFAGSVAATGQPDSPDMASRMIRNLTKDSSRLTKTIMAKRDWHHNDFMALENLSDTMAQILGVPVVSSAIDVRKLIDGGPTPDDVREQKAETKEEHPKTGGMMKAKRGGSGFNSIKNDLKM
jgi:hypothetical protein